MPSGRVVPEAERCVEDGCQLSGNGPGRRCRQHLTAYQVKQKWLNDRARLMAYLERDRLRGADPTKCPAHPSEDRDTCEGCEAIAEDRIQRGEF